ncbi:unnamed protein product [Schistosoma turkestanicum]|nr:unnamed protein product [Schistosoma turkestanicum]
MCIHDGCSPFHRFGNSLAINRAIIPLPLSYTNIWFIVLSTMTFIVIIVLVLISQIFDLEEVMIVCAVFAAVLLIILMLIVGQVTFGKPELRIVGDDYCLATLFLYTVLMMDQLTGIQLFGQQLNLKSVNCVAFEYPVICCSINVMYSNKEAKQASPSVRRNFPSVA